MQPLFHQVKTAILSTILTLTFFSTSQAESLQEAVQYMLVSNPDILAIRHNRLARDQEVKQARSGYFPELNLNAGTGKDDVYEPFEDTLSPYELTLSLRQNVFAGLSTKNEVARQEARVRSEAYLLQATSENFSLRAAEVYFQVLRHSDLLALAEENLIIHQRIADQIELRSQSGISRRSDIDQAQSRLLLAESNLILAKTNFLDAETNYQAVIGHMPQKLTMPESFDDLLPESKELASHQAVSAHPQLKSAKADLEARHAQDEVAKSPFMPTIDLEVDRIWTDDIGYTYDTRDNLIGMVRLRYNFFQGWNDTARKAETIELINEAREIRNHTQRQVVESIRLSWMAYQASKKRIEYQKLRVTATQNTAAAYTEQWNIGSTTLLDVLDSEAERIDAQQDYVNAIYDRHYSQYRILNGMGTLVHALHLEWPKESFVDQEEDTNN